MDVNVCESVFSPRGPAPSESGPRIATRDATRLGSFSKTILRSEEEREGKKKKRKEKKRKEKKRENEY